VRETLPKVVCVECGLVAPPDAQDYAPSSPSATRTREDAEEVAVYCPACAAWEFGGPRNTRDPSVT
jgi:hypothetical protein